MRKTFLLLLIAASLGGHAQTSREDSILNSITDYEEFFDELENFIDSITAPRSFATVNAGVTPGFFSFYDENRGQRMQKKAVVIPSAGYYHKDGLGFSLQGAAIMESGRLLPYQLSATGSYDYLQNRRFLAGFSYSRIFTRDSLDFYTSPLCNELNAYFTYRRWWLKPAVAASYAWGSRRSFEEVKKQFVFLRLPYGYTTTETVETVNDFMVTASVKHDFYWLDVLAKKDYIRLSPQLAVLAGTQRFGFNQTENAYLNGKKGSKDFLLQSRTAAISNSLKFQPLLVSASVKSDWSKGIFFIQPQFSADYLLNADKKLITAVALNAGIIF